MEPSREEVAWLAGLYEGEGCACTAGTRGVVVAITMTDLDVLESVNLLFPSTRPIVRREHRSDKRPHSHSDKWKPTYTWTLTRGDLCAQFLTLVMPWLYERRRIQAQHLLSVIAARPGPERSWTRCSRGHLLSGANVVTYDGRRNCLTCRRWRAHATYLRRTGRAHEVGPPPPPD